MEAGIVYVFMRTSIWRFGFTASILWILRAFIWYGCLTALQEASVIVLGEMELRKQVPEQKKSMCGSPCRHGRQRAFIVHAFPQESRYLVIIYLSKAYTIILT